MKEKSNKNSKIEKEITIPQAAAYDQPGHDGQPISITINPDQWPYIVVGPAFHDGWISRHKTLENAIKTVRYNRPTDVMASIMDTRTEQWVY